MSRCRDCDARLDEVNTVYRAPGKPRNQCRACFNRDHAARNRTGMPPGRPPADAPRAELSPLEQHRLRSRVTELERKNKTLLDDLDRADIMSALAADAATAAARVKPIKPRERKSNVREATALALASDWHIEEPVRPEQVAHRNRYDLDIARQRMTRFFEAVRWGIGFNRQAFAIRDLVLWLGGDLITNYLHDDNVETNQLSPVQAIAEAQACISAGIAFLLEDTGLERLIIPCNDGNHGRLTDKTRSASRVANSIEWLLYTTLAREWSREPRVEFLIADSEHLYYEVYGRTVRFTHGDTVRYAGGVGGVTIPLYKAVSRWDTVRRADLTVLGHFHQLTQLRDLVINGSLIGYSPYSLTIGARFEPPAQAFTILDPLRFNSVSMPLWVSSVEDDATRGVN